uniref:Mitochondrial ribosomal protein S24 n=1 Tax=Salarias fasciatus TaxID=181472 RepID=A0A672I0Y9_SALFA
GFSHFTVSLFLMHISCSRFSTKCSLLCLLCDCFRFPPAERRGSNRAARIRVGKGDKGVTYEQALPPHHIGHRKGWLSQHTGNLKGESGASDRVVEDVFIRRFMFGTFHGCLANEVVLKRRGNVLVVCALMIQKLPPQKFYFLIGYTQSLLSHFYKCPVKLEIQTLPDKVVYKYL